MGVNARRESAMAEAAYGTVGKLPGEAIKLGDAKNSLALLTERSWHLSHIPGENLGEEE